MLRSGHIAVIGAGKTGKGIIHLLSDKGNEVVVYDADSRIQKTVKDGIKNNLKILVQYGNGSEEEIIQVLDRIHLAESLKEAVKGARLVIESGADELEEKRNLLRKIEFFCSPTTIIASTVFYFSVSDVATKLESKERLVGVHFWDPAFLVPLVEVKGSPETSDEVLDYVCRVLESAGKKPLKIKKDIPGFVGLRLQYALWFEAISIVQQGIADAETVDEVIKSGPGIRWSVSGPLQEADMLGLDRIIRIYKYIYPHVETSREVPELLLQKKKAGEIGARAGLGFYDWRQNSIEECKTRLLKHLVRWKREQLPEC